MKKYIVTVMTFFIVGLTPPLGDRLIFSINNLSYSQRQVEVSFYIKEALREQAGSTPMVIIDQENWQSIMNVFAEDMIVLQEAVRLGSFQINNSALQKYAEIVVNQAKKDKTLSSNLARLGVGKKTLYSEVENALRVAGFRKSKSRQNKEGITDSTLTPTDSKWIAELTERTVIRTYEGAEKYLSIHPHQDAVADE